MDEENIFMIWFERRNLSKNSRTVYRRYMKQYAEFTNKSISQLYSEAIADEKNNVYLLEREYYKDSLKFIKHLRDIGKSINTVNVAITSINAFYKAFKIRSPEIETKKGDLTQEKNYGRALTKKDIRRLVDVANAKQSAIIYLMALSGFSQAEMRKLKLRTFFDSVNNEVDYEFNNIKEIIDHENEIKELLLQVEITREKVHYRYTTFIPPETVARILTYLRERYHTENDKMENLNAALIQRRNRTPYDAVGIVKIFSRLGKKAGFKQQEYGAYRFWRSHALRHYFITTFIDDVGDYIVANYLAGHRISDQDKTYWRSNPQKLRQKYIKALHYLSIDEGKSITFESEEYKKAKKKIKHLEKNQENLKPLADAIQKNPQLLEIIAKELTKKER